VLHECYFVYAKSYHGRSIFCILFLLIVDRWCNSATPFGHNMIVLWTPAIFWVHHRPLLHNLITLVFKKVSKTYLQILFPIQPKIIYWQYKLQTSCLQFSWGHYEQRKIVLRPYKLACLSKSLPIIPVSWKYCFTWVSSVNMLSSIIDF
jgi:hypothetical protein